MPTPHTITHVEIPAPDIEKAIQFYSTVFKWKIERLPDQAYAFFRIEDTQTGGGLDGTLSPAPEKSGHQLVINVDDIPRMLGAIQQYGGSITIGKTEIPGGHGFYACFQDPNKNHLQIHSRT